MPVINNIPTTQYIGPKIIPHLWDPILWDSTIQYDALAVVQYNGAGYISRFIPPIGTNPSDTEYWVKWSDFNAQLAQVQQQVETLANSIDDKVSETDFQNAVDDINAAIAQKADTTALESAVETINDTIAQKADITSVETINDTLAQKADITSVDEVQSQIDTINDDIDTLSEKAFDFIGISNSSPFENLQQLYEVFLSWKTQENSLFYGAPSLFALDHNEDFTAFAPMDLRKTIVDGTYKSAMSCSALTLCALMGITYERSRYANGTQTTIDAIPYITGGKNYPMGGSQFLDFENKTVVKYWQRFKADMSIDPASNAMYCSGLAHWLFDCGLLIPCTNNEMVSKCAPGDLLFYRNADETSDIYYWENLSHVDIFMGWNGDRSFNVLSSSGSVSVVNFAKRNITTELTTKLAFIARIPSAIPSPDATNLIAGNSAAKNLTHAASSSFTFPRIAFDDDKILSGTGLHTAVIKMNSFSGTNVRFNIYGAHLNDTVNSSQRGVIYLDNEGCYIGNNCYYCIYDERYTWDTIDTNVGGIRLVVNADSAYNVDIAEIRFYDYPIQPKPF